MTQGHIGSGHKQILGRVGRGEYTVVDFRYILRSYILVEAMNLKAKIYIVNSKNLLSSVLPNVEIITIYYMLFFLTDICQVRLLFHLQLM